MSIKLLYFETILTYLTHIVYFFIKHCRKSVDIACICPYPHFSVNPRIGVIFAFQTDRFLPGILVIPSRMGDNFLITKRPNCRLQTKQRPVTNVVLLKIKNEKKRDNKLIISKLILDMNLRVIIINQFYVDDVTTFCRFSIKIKR